MSAAKMSDSDWIQMLVSATPMFDEAILADIRKADIWIGNVSSPWTPQIPEWFTCREAVRKISEGLAFKPSTPPKPEPMGMPFDVTQDRFRAVYPDMSQAWKR